MQTLLAYAVSLCVYQISTVVIGGGFGMGTAAAILVVIGFVYFLLRPYKQDRKVVVNRKKIVKA